MGNELKSALELALEKLDQDEGMKVESLTDEQREQIQETRSIYKAKTAENEIHFTSKIQQALLSGNQEDAAALGQRMKQEKKSLEDKLESKLARIREGT